MKKDNKDQEKLREKNINIATKQMMGIMLNLTLPDAFDAFTATAAFYIETCGTLGLDADEVEETMCEEIHMVRKNVKEQFDRLRSIRPEDRSIMDRVAFEAKILEHKVQFEQTAKDFIEKNPGVLHASVTDLKMEQLEECFSEFKRIMARIREISPQIYQDKFESSMEFLERQHQKVERFEEKMGLKEQKSNLS